MDRLVSGIRKKIKSSRSSVAKKTGKAATKKRSSNGKRQRNNTSRPKTKNDDDDEQEDQEMQQESDDEPYEVPEELREQDDDDDEEDEDENGDPDKDDDEEDEGNGTLGTSTVMDQHFGDAISDSLFMRAAIVDANKLDLEADEHKLLHRVMISSVEGSPRIQLPSHDAKEPSLDDLKIKTKIQLNWANINSKLCKKTGAEALTPLQQALFPLMNAYVDILYTNQSFKYEQDIRNLIALHALNHVLKQVSVAQDRMQKNSAKIKADIAHNRPTSELRDQGFTRPRVLILAPLRNNAFHIIQALLAISGSTMQDNKKRFNTEFGGDEDYQRLFTGDIDDCFRIGLKVSGKRIKLFSNFYASDILVASPLGLKMILGSEGDKHRDFDFLSSIEIVMMEHTDVFLMQNWDHVKVPYGIPKNPHGCDFSRVRTYTLDGRSKYVRQNIIFSQFNAPEINSLVTNYSRNVAGRVKMTREYEGAISNVLVQAPQIFQRIPPHSIADSPDARFNYFIEIILPTLRQSIVQQTHTLIFIPSYFDYVRLRNYLKEHNYNFGGISEYSQRSDSDRTRFEFANGNISYLVCTERFYFFRRNKLKGVRHVVFYQVPVNPGFYAEILNLLDTSAGDVTCSTLFSAFDKLALERVVGSKRVDRMIKSQKDTFMFTS
eukprot:jgi/Hompol1/4199/HPOL_003563-RA